RRRDGEHAPQEVVRIGHVLDDVAGDHRVEALPGLLELGEVVADDAHAAAIGNAGRFGIDLDAVRGVAPGQRHQQVAGATADVEHRTLLEKGRERLAYQRLVETILFLPGGG